MRLRSHGLSDVGRKRILNEDSFLSDDSLGFFVVADGVGGQAKGEIASALSVEEAYGFVKRQKKLIDQFVDEPSDENRFSVHRLMESAVQLACYMIFGLAEQDPNRQGMSTTMSALLISDRAAFLSQVGDSRIYRLRAGEIKQLTEDHTLINYKIKHGLITPEEAERSKGKNVITRAVGHRDHVQVDTTTCDVMPADRFLLCTDGLHTYLTLEEFGALMGSGSLEEVSRRCVDLANERGGKDNITTLIIDVF